MAEPSSIDTTSFHFVQDKAEDKKYSKEASGATSPFFQLEHQMEDDSALPMEIPSDANAALNIFPSFDDPDGPKSIKNIKVDRRIGDSLTQDVIMDLVEPSY